MIENHFMFSNVIEPMLVTLVRTKDEALFESAKCALINQGNIAFKWVKS